MTQQKTLKKLTLLFTALLTLGTAQAQTRILPKDLLKDLSKIPSKVEVDFAPVGITMDQTARLNLLNVDAANGMFINWRFIDANGLTLAQSAAVLPMGKIVSVDFKRPTDLSALNSDPAVSIRAEVRAQVEIRTLNVSSESLRGSLEVFNNDTGATTVYMSSAAQ